MKLVFFLFSAARSGIKITRETKAKKPRVAIDRSAEI